MIRRNLGTKRKEITVSWRKLHNEELHAVYLSSNNNRMIKSRKIRWEGHVVRMEEERNAFNFSVRKSERRTPL
jgi:hypothetical protein